MTVIKIDTATIAQEVAKQGRTNRTPQHDFYLSTMPYAIQPFMIAPVLPGETLKNGLLQARVVSDPIKAPLIGWHSEWYIFYVKLRDLNIRDDLTDMLISGTSVPDWTSPITNDQNDKYSDKSLGLSGNGGINYMRRCLERVTEEYFRDEGDNPPLIDLGGTDQPGLPPATIQTREFWHQSAKLESAMPAGDSGELPGADDYADANIPPEWANHFEQYQRMRALKLTEVTFEDWLRQFGVKAPKDVREDLHRPELLRYVRDWTYPTNTVDPATGIPNTVVAWSIAERLDKARFFAEPGFIFGVNVTRPKIYLGRQRQPAVEMLNDAFSWLPALMNGDPYTSLKRFDANQGPLGHHADGARPSEAYWVDARDLFLYGDQFCNKYMDQVDGINTVLRPSAGLERRYMADAEIKPLFKDQAVSRIRCDGVMQLTIAGNQKDHT